MDMKVTHCDTRSFHGGGPSLELPAFGHGDPTKIRCGSHRSTSAKTPTEHHQRCAPPSRQAPERHCRRTPDPPASKTNKSTVNSGPGTPSSISAHSQQPTRPPFSPPQRSPSNLNPPPTTVFTTVNNALLRQIRRLAPPVGPPPPSPSLNRPSPHPTSSPPSIPTPKINQEPKLRPESQPATTSNPPAAPPNQKSLPPMTNNQQHRQPHHQQKMKTQNPPAAT